jgi:hypothetical protein
VFIGLAFGYVLHAYTSTMMAPHLAVEDTGQTVNAASIYAWMFLMDPWTYVTAAVAVFGAVTRVRNIG